MEVLVRPGHYPGTLPTLGYLPIPVLHIHIDTYTKDPSPATSQYHSLLSILYGLVLTGIPYYIHTPNRPLYSWYSTIVYSVLLGEG